MLKSTVELSFGKMCIRTYSCKEMRKVGVGGQREKLTHKVVSLSHLWRAKSCLKWSHRNHVSSHHWTDRSLKESITLDDMIHCAETISSGELSQYSQELRDEPFEPDKGT